MRVLAKDLQIKNMMKLRKAALIEEILNAAAAEADEKSADGGDANTVHGGGFCPYCGAKAEEGYEYCRRCGKKLPD